jgi:hypothetical protein
VLDSREELQLFQPHRLNISGLDFCSTGQSIET